VLCQGCEIYFKVVREICIYIYIYIYICVCIVTYIYLYISNYFINNEDIVIILSGMSEMTYSREGTSCICI
jgi:hypothetical protein